MDPSYYRRVRRPVFRVGARISGEEEQGSPSGLPLDDVPEEEDEEEDVDEDARVPRGETRNRAKHGRDWRRTKTLVRRLIGDEDDDFRLSPVDDVLERLVDSVTKLMWVPCLPGGYISETGPFILWRRWAFEQAHATLLNPHRSAGHSFQILRRMAWWHEDFNKWYADCQVFRQYRSKAVPPPGHGMLSAEH